MLRVLRGAATNNCVTRANNLERFTGEQFLLLIALRQSASFRILQQHLQMGG